MRDSIFDSLVERHTFDSIHEKWSNRFAIYPQIPLDNIIELGYEEVCKLRNDFFPDLQTNYYYQAQVDYTICKMSGRPLFSVEFDGIRGGYSRGTSYIIDGQEDPHRQRRLAFKLALASKVDYPLLVVSYDEIQPLQEGDQLLILDAIIGNCMASTHFREQIDRNLSELNDANRDSNAITDENIELLVWDTEVQTELEGDPVARLAAEYQLECSKKGIFRFKMEPISEPPLPDYDGIFDFKGLEKRLEAMKRLDAVGCRVSVETPSKTIVEEVLLRNFGTIGVDPNIIAENIAKYRIFKKALQF